MPVDFHFRGLPSRPGSVLGTGAWTSGTGPRSTVRRRGPRNPPEGAALVPVALVPDAVTGRFVDAFAAVGVFCAKISVTEAKPSKVTIRIRVLLMVADDKYHGKRVNQPNDIVMLATRMAARLDVSG